MLQTNITSYLVTTYCPRTLQQQRRIRMHDPYNTAARARSVRRFRGAADNMGRSLLAHSADSGCSAAAPPAARR